MSTLIEQIPDNELIDIINKCDYKYQILKIIGYKSVDKKALSILNNRLSQLNISVIKHHIDLTYYRKGIYHPTIRRRLLKDHLLKYECAICHNQGIWQNQDLCLQVDHIDGNASNNELSNLRFLCPNCHSQTDTFGNKNKIQRTADRHSHYQKKCKYCHKSFTTNGNRQMFCSRQCSSNFRKKPIPTTKSKLFKQISELGFVKTGEIYNVSDNTIRKWCVKLNLPTKIIGYK